HQDEGEGTQLGEKTSHHLEALAEHGRPPDALGRAALTRRPVDVKPRLAPPPRRLGKDDPLLLAVSIEVGHDRLRHPLPIGHVRAKEVVPLGRDRGGKGGEILVLRRGSAGRERKCQQDRDPDASHHEILSRMRGPMPGASSPMVYARQNRWSGPSLPGRSRRWAKPRGSPRSTGSPPLFASTKPTAGSMESSFLRRPASRAIAARPTSWASIAWTKPSRGAR